jgi:1-acyl-sn-glycerol-3-phosphate acyltransferase
VFYWALKPFVVISLRVFYKIDLRGLENMRYDQPVVLAPNHVNGFVDPVMLGMFIRKKVRFFARGDAFKGKFAKWILNQMNVSPMFRIQEGFAEIKKNDKSFEESRQLLTENKIILLFPEAVCVSERRLRPLKKGLARIVFQTGESFDFNKDILVIPVGLNYNDPTRFRSKISIDIGEPVSVKEYEASYRKDKVRAINDFTKVLEKKMHKNVLSITNPENDRLVAGLEEIYTESWLKEKNLECKNQHNAYIASREMVNMVNVLDEKKPELISDLRNKVKVYQKRLRQNGLRDHLLKEESINKTNIGTFIFECIVIYLGMPFYLIGLLMNYPPYYLAGKFADKKIKKPEFYPSIRVFFSLILWSVYFLIQLVIIGIAFNSWLLTGVYAVAICLTGLFVLAFHPVMKKIIGRWKLLRMARKERKVVEELLNQRNEIMNDLRSAKNEYHSLK